MPDLNRFFTDLGAGVSEQGKLLQSLWQKLNTPLQPITSDSSVEQMLADETTPLSLAANIIPPLAAVKRFRHMPSMIAKKLGQIQDTHKLTGGDVPTYHGSNVMFPDLPAFMTKDEYVLDQGIYDKTSKKIDYLSNRLANTDNTDLMRAFDDAIAEESGRPISARLRDIKERTRYSKAITKLREFMDQQEVPSVYSYLDPAPATEHGSRVAEVITDLSDHGYEPWDMKGHLKDHVSSPAMLEGKSDDVIRKIAEGEEKGYFKDPRLYKQELFEKNRDRAGMILDPVRYIDAELRNTATFNLTPTEDFVPQIATWDPNTKRRLNRYLVEDDPTEAPSFADVEGEHVGTMRPDSAFRIYDDFFKSLVRRGFAGGDDINAMKSLYKRTQRPSIVTDSPRLFDLPSIGRGRK